MNEQDTSGFYIYSDQLYAAPNFVSSSDFEILRENKDDYEYPVHGWYWFNSEEEARSFFGLPTIITEQN